MTSIKKGFIILCAFLFLALNNYAETGYKYLKISPSPACSSLGDACSSFYNNASSFYYNPALLCINPPKFTLISPLFKTIDFYLSYIKYFTEMNYISFFSVMDIKKINRIGIGFVGLFYGDITLSSYEEENYIAEKKINISSYSFSIGYGYNITKKIGAGINLKFPIDDLGNKTCIGIGTDIGGIYKEKNWKVALVIQNIGYDTKKIDELHSLPTTIKIGGNYGLYLFKKKYPMIHKITITGDIGKEIEDDFIAGTGLEYNFKEIIFIRNGYLINRDEVDIRLGCGFKYKNYCIDYGYNWNDLANIHRIGFGMKFNLSKKEIETEQTKKGTVIKISEADIILFKYNKADLKKGSLEMLDKVVDILKAKKDKDILICGHTDNKREDKFNLKLSRKRAKAVYNYFIKKGIKKKRMEVKGYGEKNPVASNKTPEGRAKNRRVEIILLKLNKKEKEEFDYHYYSGLDCYMKGGYKYAIIEWEKALKINPDNEDTKIWIKKAKKELK